MKNKNMGQNIIEYIREETLKKILSVKSVKKSWHNGWKEKIEQYIGTPATVTSILNLGDHLRDIFKETSPESDTRGSRAETSANGNDENAQGILSESGTCWENLVCWYLNLCLIGRRTVVFKNYKSFMPSCINEALTVTYTTRDGKKHESDSELDLVAITFPNSIDYAIDKEEIEAFNTTDNRRINTHSRKYPLKPVLDYLCARDFKDLKIDVLQCKTNWNDNVQILLLWDIIYNDFRSKPMDKKNTGCFKHGIYVGTSAYSINDLPEGAFSYSFITAPSNSLIDDNGNDAYTTEKVSIWRVNRLSGGNYWGKQTVPGVASSVKDILLKGPLNKEEKNISETLSNAIPLLSSNAINCYHPSTTQIDPVGNSNPRDFIYNISFEE